MKIEMFPVGKNVNALYLPQKRKSLKKPQKGWQKAFSLRKTR
jgi:hypothetical protein